MLDMRWNFTIAVNMLYSLMSVLSLPPLPPSMAGNWTIKVSLDSCIVTQPMDGSSSVSQYGVKPDACSDKSFYPSCKSFWVCCILVLHCSLP